MSDYRLLVDWEVIEKVNELPIGTRRALRRAIAQIAASPDRMSDYREPNPRQIDLDVHVCKNFALKYWIDFADRHIKILEIEPAD